jgi:hypothetical protein
MKPALILPVTQSKPENGKVMPNKLQTKKVLKADAAKCVKLTNDRSSSVVQSG